MFFKFYDRDKTVINCNELAYYKVIFSEYKNQYVINLYFIHGKETSTYYDTKNACDKDYNRLYEFLNK